MLQRMRELAVQSANGTNSRQRPRRAAAGSRRSSRQEIDRIATHDPVQRPKLLDGTFTAQQFQVGANAGETITVASIANATAEWPGTPTPPSTYTQTQTSRPSPRPAWRRASCRSTAARSIAATVGVAYGSAALAGTGLVAAFDAEKVGGGAAVAQPT